MKLSDRDILVALVAAALTTLILVLDFIALFAADPSILDGALIFGSLWLMYKLGRNGGS